MFEISRVDCSTTHVPDLTISNNGSIMGRKENPGEKKVAKDNEIVLLQKESLVSSSHLRPSQKGTNSLMKRICRFGVNNEFALFEQSLFFEARHHFKGFYRPENRK